MNDDDDFQRWDKCSYHKFKIQHGGEEGQNIIETSEDFRKQGKIMSVRKKPVVVHAIKMPRPFRVKTMEGVLEGKAGDYLIRGIAGELYPHDQDIFPEVYEVLCDDVQVEEKLRCLSQEE